MAGYSLSELEADIRSYTEVVEYEGTLAADVQTVRVPAGMVFVRGIEVFNSTSSRTGPATWLLKRDRTFINEYVGELTGPSGGSTGQDVTGLPKYYAMFGGATGTASTTSGNIIMAPN